MGTKQSKTASEIQLAAEIIKEFIALQVKKGSATGYGAYTVREIFARCAEDMEQPRFRSIVKKYGNEISTIAGVPVSYDAPVKREKILQGDGSHDRRSGLNAKSAQIVIGY